MELRYLYYITEFQICQYRGTPREILLEYPYNNCGTPRKMVGEGSNYEIKRRNYKTHTRGMRRKKFEYL